MLTVPPLAPPLHVVPPAAELSGLEKLRGKIERNLRLGLTHFARRGLSFAAAEARTRWTFHCVHQLGVGVRIIGRSPKINDAGGTLRIGDDVVFSSPVTATYLELAAGALLSIGDETFLNDGVWLGCAEQIRIGRRVLIGPGVRCFDNAYHGTYQRRVVPPSRPVTIEDDVWIASDSIILPGVTIGRGAIVAAHTVVLDDVAPFTIVAGNPARQIKVLDEKRFDLGR